MFYRFIIIIFSMIIMTIIAGCGKSESNSHDKVMFLSAGDKIKTLDPALAADLLSQYMVASFYDTLLQYNYDARPYRLEPSMLAKMPEISNDMMHYQLTLRNDIYFFNDPCFGSPDKEKRRVTARDVAYTIMRIADDRIHSPVYWMFRGKIKGLDDFQKRTATAAPGDMSPYDTPCEGLEVINDRTLIIHLTNPEPRLNYALSIPSAGIVSRKAVEYYGEDFQAHPVGSGPFKVGSYIRDYQITLERNPDYRFETYHLAKNPADRVRPLPLTDRIVCYLVKQPLAGWLMFLQGELDMSTLDKDNYDAVVGEDRKLVKALDKRGIIMQQIPEFEVRYLGFNFTDPLLADNLNLRRAISLAYNVPLREKHFNYQMITASSPIPPGVPGHNSDYHNPWGQYNLERAKELMRLAGYPNGVDPKTGLPLEITFDQAGTTAQYRQLAELMVEDMKKIGIKIKPVLNNRARFFEKLRKGQFQMFRISWVGDYPDAENFLQLFYGPNAGSCNRTFFRDAKFDKMYEAIRSMPDTQARTARYYEMSLYINDQCPWVLEGYPIAFQLTHSWLQNYRPHDFSFARWKYMAIDIDQRRKAKKSFRPLEMKDLQK